MRLTLRTLLAYMDGVLESEDAEEIARKVEESEFATGVVHRTRDVVRRLRLGAPPLEPRGKGLDANSVAEYLDNTLSSDRVTDFEKLCLESDVHLAEVAACHQILTYVLGSPADIEPDTRQRMYELVGTPGKDRPAEAPAQDADLNRPMTAAARRAAAAAAANGAPRDDTDGQAVSPQRDRPEVPDYLRDPPPAPKTGRVLAIVLLLVVGAAIVIGSQPAWLPNFLKFGPAQDVALKDKEDSNANQGDTGKSPDDANTDNSGAPQGNHAESNTTESNGAARPEGSPELRQPDDANQVGRGDGSGNGTGDHLVNPIPPLPDADTTNHNDTTNHGANSNAAANPPANNDAANNAAGNAGSADGGNVANNAGSTGGNGEVVDPNLPGNIPLPVVTPREAGVLSSTESVLLRFGGNPPSLTRVPPKGKVFTNEPLVSLPDFRNVISFADGVSLDAVGETHFELEPVGAETDIPRIRLEDGRIVLTTVGAINKQLRIRTGNLEYALTFLQPGSVLAISAQRVRQEGGVPDEQAAPYELVVSAVAGKTVWESFARGGRWELSAGQQWAQQAGPSDPFVASVSPPDWVSNMGISPLAAKATEPLEVHIRGELAVRARQALLEMVSSNRIEVSALATRCLAAIDDFAPVIESLDDERYRSYWDDQVASLQAAVARSPESASLVNIALQTNRSEDAPELYRMLWGYTATDLRDGGHAQKLVEYLSHDDLDFRLLASWNLKRITGIDTIIYRPEGSPNARQRAATQWRLKLDAGQIVPQSVQR